MSGSGSMLEAGHSPAALFAVACPACGKSLAAAARDAGRRAKCPCCNAALLLPAAPPVGMPAEGSAAADARIVGPGVPILPPANIVPVPAAPAPQSAAVGPPSTANDADGGAAWPVAASPLPTFELPADLFADHDAARITPPEPGSGTVPVAGGIEGTIREQRDCERRRSRRSLLMLVIGSVILLGIVFAFTGIGSRR